MDRTVVHIFEPTARSPFGHHFGYCERASLYLQNAGYDVQEYYAWEGAEDKELRSRARNALFSFNFRFCRAFERSYGAEITEADPAIRRSVRDAKTAAAGQFSDGSIESENRLWRLRYDLDIVAAGYPQSNAEAEVEAEVRKDLSSFGSLLNANYGSDENILFLPTGEYYLLKGLLAEFSSLCRNIKQIHIRLWNFLSLERNGADLLELSLKLQSDAAGRGVDVFLYAEAPWACDRLSKFSRTQVGYLDINSFSETAFFAPRAAERASATAKQPFHVYFPGAYRRFPDKGLGFLRALILEPSLPENFRLVIQQPDFAALRLSEDLIRRNQRVVVLPRLLDDAEYLRQFRSASLICLPYDDVTWPDTFRGSGVIFEAFLQARPVAVASHTPLARFTEFYSVNLFDGEDEFLSLVANFDIRAQEQAAIDNFERYASAVKDNDLLRLLPKPRQSRRPADVSAT